MIMSRACELSSHGLLPDLHCQECVSNCRKGLKSNHKVVAPVTFVPLLHLYLVMLVIIVAHTLHSWVRLFELFSTATYIAPSSTMKALQQHGDFLVSTDLFSPFPVTKVCDALSNMVFPSPSDGEPIGMTIAYLILCVSGTHRNKNSRSIPLLTPGFFLRNPCILEEYCLLCSRSLSPHVAAF